MTLRVELAAQDGEPVACSCGEERIPVVAGMPIETAQVAAYLRDQLGPGAEVCTYADGRISFAREPGAPRTVVRGRME